MKDEREFEEMKKEYLEVKIPAELESRVNDALKMGIKRRRQNQMRWVKVVASAAATFVLVINVSPTFADTLENIPGIGQLIKVINIREYTVKGERQEANIQVPQIEGLTNESLQAELNKQLQEEADAVYAEFLEMAKKWETVDSAANYSVDMNYEVLTDTEDIFAMRVNKLEIIASANQEVKFYVIDKQKETAITLPTLFKDDTYVERISKYVIEEMEKIMQTDSTKVFWIQEDEFAKFERIDPNQKFFINSEGKLVIHFDKYEVGPGSTGESEFVIPTELIADLLVDETIIK